MIDDRRKKRGDYRAMGESGAENASQKRSEAAKQASQPRGGDAPPAMTSEQFESVQNLANKLVNETGGKKARARLREEIVGAVNSADGKNAISFGGYSIEADGSVTKGKRSFVMEGGASRIVQSTVDVELKPQPPRRRDFPIPSVRYIEAQPSGDSGPPAAEGGGWSGSAFVNGVHYWFSPEERENARWLRVRVQGGTVSVTLESTPFPTQAGASFPGNQEYYRLSQTWGDIHCDMFS